MWLLAFECAWFGAAPWSVRRLRSHELGDLSVLARGRCTVRGRPRGPGATAFRTGPSRVPVTFPYFSRMHGVIWSATMCSACDEVLPFFHNLGSTEVRHSTNRECGPLLGTPRGCPCPQKDNTRGWGPRATGRAGARGAASFIADDARTHLCCVVSSRSGARHAAVAQSVRVAQCCCGASELFTAIDCTQGAQDRHKLRYTEWQKLPHGGFPLAHCVCTARTLPQATGPLRVRCTQSLRAHVLQPHKMAAANDMCVKRLRKLRATGPLSGRGLRAQGLAERPFELEPCVHTFSNLKEW